MSPDGLCLCGCGRQTPIAKRTQYRPLGTIKDKPAAYLIGHRKRGVRRLPDVLWVVDEETGCWLWQASCQPSGYGQIRHNDEVVLAHRYVFEQQRGPIPAGMHLHHLCKTPPCVNPSHLELVSPSRHAGRHARVSQEARRQIIERVRAGELQSAVAADFSITPQYAGQLALKWQRALEKTG